MGSTVGILASNHLFPIYCLGCLVVHYVPFVHSILMIFSPLTDWFLDMEDMDMEDMDMEDME